MDNIINKLDSVIQDMIYHKDNLPGTDFCKNVDELINIKCEITNKIKIIKDQFE